MCVQIHCGGASDEVVLYDQIATQHRWRDSNALVGRRCLRDAERADDEQLSASDEQLIECMWVTS